MACCPDCTLEFPALEADSVCAKCIKINAAKTNIEKEMAESLKQCPLCGLAAKNLGALCGRCTMRQSGTHPTLGPVQTVLGGAPLSVASAASGPAVPTSATAIFAAAEQHRGTATGFRIQGKKVMTTEDVLKNRIDAKKLAQMSTVPVTWDIYQVVQGGGKKRAEDTQAMLQQESYDVDKPMSAVLDDIRRNVMGTWIKLSLHLSLGTITHEHIEFGLKEDARSAPVDIREDQVRPKTIGQYATSLASRLPWSSAKDVKINLRVLVRLQARELEYAPNVSKPTTRSAGTLKRTKGGGASDDLSLGLPRKRAAGAGSSILRATDFRFKEEYAEVEVRMFKKTIFKAELDSESRLQDVMVADKGQEQVMVRTNGAKPFGGYKAAVEGRYGGDAVAVCWTTGRHGINFSVEDNISLLKQEGRALALGRLFASLFFEDIDGLVSEGLVDPRDVTRFTFNDAWFADFGEDALTTDSYLRETAKLAPRRHVLISPLLPTWPEPFVKLAGADVIFDLNYSPDYASNLSAGVFERLKPLLAAFVHYVLAQSDCTFIFADIQGAWSANSKTFILSDPQMHTFVAPGEWSQTKPVASWDNQMEGLHAFKENHSCNDFCEALELSSVEDIFAERESRKGRKGASKFSIEGILNEQDKSPKISRRRAKSVESESGTSGKGTSPS